MTALFGVILAVPALKVKGSYLALLTMGFGEVVRIVMINWTPVTNSTAGIRGIASPVILGFAFDTLKKYYLPPMAASRPSRGSVWRSIRARLCPSWVPTARASLR